ncbi:MAG: Hsp20/alpha crystallin family protein [Isosphaeraceae bacterium]
MALLTRWEPFGGLQQDLSRFRRDIDRLFSGYGAPALAWPVTQAVTPAMNISEDDNFIYAAAEMPGQKIADLDITITGENRLTIKGRREVQSPEKAEWHRRERPAGAFERTIELPVAMDPASIEARLEHGILAIKMAKSPKARPRRIEVRAE